MGYCFSTEDIIYDVNLKWQKWLDREVVGSNIL
jgi:hypothetical protein